MRQVGVLVDHQRIVEVAERDRDRLVAGADRLRRRSVKLPPPSLSSTLKLLLSGWTVTISSMPSPLMSASRT